MKLMTWFELDIFARVFDLMGNWKDHYGKDHMTDEEVDEITKIFKAKLLTERDIAKEVVWKFITSTNQL